jgi:cytochrome P450
MITSPTRTTTRVRRSPLPRATLPDALGALSTVLVPTIAKGPIIRRPAAVALAERFELDDKAVRFMAHLRERYGRGPVVVSLPGLRLALVLDPQDVHAVLEGAPEPFAPASTLKRSALSHFQPHNVLISSGPERQHRRAYHEEVLEFPRPLHSLADRFAGVVWEESTGLFARVGRGGVLDWPTFAQTWFRVVRRVVFGDRAADDVQVTAMIDRLRADANWAFIKPKRRGLRERFLGRVTRYLARAEPGSLAHLMAAKPATNDPVTKPEQQVPQWLFAFDPAGMTTFRALALLTTHLEHEERARDEIAASAEGRAPLLPFLRASILESLRLWPTTPMVLRTTTAETSWDERGTLPAGTEVLIYAPFFHRDRTRLTFADRFAPELWDRERTTSDWPLIPFSSGPAACPGQMLVLHTTATMLSALLAERRFRLLPPVPLDPRRALPGTLDNYRLRFRLVD